MKDNPSMRMSPMTRGRMTNAFFSAASTQVSRHHCSRRQMQFSCGVSISRHLRECGGVRHGSPRDRSWQPKFSSGVRSTGSRHTRHMPHRLQLGETAFIEARFWDRGLQLFGRKQE